MMFFKQVISAVALVAAATSSAAIAQVEPVSLSTAIQVVETSEVGGEVREAFVEPNKVIPGDALLFTTSFSNNTADSIGNFTIVNPLPADMLLSEQSAAENDVSVDGGENFGAIADLTVTDENGVSRAAVAADVTHLRWVVSSLAAGENGSVQYRASVR